MNNRAQFDQLLAAQPFRPFWLETTGGNQIRVLKREWLLQPSATGYSFVVFSDEGTYTILNYSDLTDTIRIEEPNR